MVNRSVSYGGFDGNVTVDFYPTAEFLMVLLAVIFLKECASIEFLHCVLPFRER